MRKKTIFLLYVLALPPLGLAVLTLLPALLHLGGIHNINLLIAVVFFLTASILGSIAWIGTLINQGKQGQWGWFICTLLFGGIALLIYLIAVPERSPQLPVSGDGQFYQPQAPMYTPPNQPPYPSFSNDPRP